MKSTVKSAIKSARKSTLKSKGKSVMKSTVIRGWEQKHISHMHFRCISNTQRQVQRQTGNAHGIYKYTNTNTLCIYVKFPTTNMSNLKISMFCFSAFPTDFQYLASINVHFGNWTCMLPPPGNIHAGSLASKI